MVEQLGEMTSLIAELIELARAEQHPDEAEDVRLDLLAETAVERARRNRPNVTFTTDFEESMVHGAPSTIERALANLLDNAAKWGPEGGEVEVSIERLSPRVVRLCVRDTGVGIDAKDLPRLLSGMGGGRGLRISRAIAERHAGELWAESTPGAFTVFHVELPLFVHQSMRMEAHAWA